MDATIAALIAQLGPQALAQVIALIEWLVGLARQPAVQYTPETVEAFLASCVGIVATEETDHPDWSGAERHQAASDAIRVKANWHGLVIPNSAINALIETTLLKLRS